MSREAFGTTRDGRPVERVTLDNGRLRASFLTLGATLQDVRLAGLDRPLTLGSDRVGDYEEGGAFHYFGAIVGPVANRIGGAQTLLDGRVLKFDPNGMGGHVLHGGAAGLHHKLWLVEHAEETRAVFSCTASDGEGGFPGNRRFETEVSLDAGTGLTLRLRAETDAPTLVSLANHSYWNLGERADFHRHVLQIDADVYLPCDATDLPTGERRPVAGTPFDFRTPRVLTATDILDNNFCLASARRDLTPAARLIAPDGLCLEIATTEPGLQVYDARHMPGTGVPGLGGRRYGPRGGIAFEAQFWPDAPNRPKFPRIRLEPGEPWEQVSRFTFARR